MQIKLLALDLDGTIVSNLRTISPRIEQAIQAAQNKDVRVTLATGREYGVTAKFARQLKINMPLICYQGGLIKNPQSDEIIQAHTVPAGTSRRVIKFARANKLPMLLFTPQTSFAELPSPAMHTMFQQAQAEFTLVNSLLYTVDENHLPLKFMFVQHKSKSDKVFQLLNNAFGAELTITRSLETLIEATMPNVSKGVALKRLTEHLDIPLAQTMAIGDQDNDVTMLQIAGLGVAMGNASERAKEVADIIAPPLSADGAAWAIEKYILKT